MKLSDSDCSISARLEGERIALVGKLGGMSRREAQQLVRRHGGSVIERPDATATLIVVGEKELPLSDSPLEDAFDEPVRQALEQGTLAVIGESQLWERLGLVDLQQQVHSLYTPAMLARLLGVGVSTIRRWRRRGWVVPVRGVPRPC